MGTIAFVASLIQIKVFCALYNEKNMKIKKLLVMVLLISGLILLAACAPESTTAPEEEQEKLVQSDAVEDSYPAPEENEVVQSGDSDEPYPGPQAGIVDYNPYPSVEVIGSASSLDLSEAIMAAEFAVEPGDKNLQAASVFIEHSEIVLKESDPVQVELVLVGHLPSPCHQLRVVALEPDNTGFIKVQAYSVSDPEKACVQVLEPFIAVVPLGSYSEGTFTLSINNEMNGEFTLP
jgi:hypothetical protein